MTKVIIFDFWGTLVDSGVRSPIKQVKYILNIKLPFSEYVVRMEKAMMTKNFSSLREAFISVCGEFNIEPSGEVLDRLVGMWNKSWMLARPYEDAEEVLRKLKEKYILVLVSNTDTFSINNVIEKFSLDGYFTKKFFSFELGTIKTDSEFLQTVLEELDLESEECILVGDSILSDMDAAKNAGIKSILVDRQDSREFPLKIKSLTDLEPLL